MLQYLEERHDIERSHKKLQATIRRGFSKAVVKDIGYPAGRERDATVDSDGRYWFWTKDHRSADVFTKRRLIWFGVLSERPGVSITVEVNTVYSGRNDQAAGFFARDVETGSIYLLHSGRVGGGTKGVGKSSFLTWAALAKQSLVSAIDSRGNIRSGLIVMPVEGEAAVKSAIRYIDLVRRFKIAARNGEIQSKKFQRQRREFEGYFAESHGRRTGQRKTKIDYISRHGEIVEALYEWRSSQRLPKRWRIVKDVYIDLGVANGKNLVEIFEVKPKADRSSIYSAIGQLLVHSRHEACHRAIVLPRDEILAPDLADALNRLRVEVIRFKFDKDSVAILES
jgi:hypothetical protein